MKKILMILLFQLSIFGFTFGATINSKYGYAGILWGSTKQEAEKAGFKFRPIFSEAEKSNLEKSYVMKVDAYNVVSRDKSVATLQFHYYMGKLFFVTETLSSTDFSQKKLESRYGNFAKQGIYLSGNQYTDAIREDGKSISSQSISISNINGRVSATMFDWNVYKSISYEGHRLLTGKQDSITDELCDMAERLVHDLLMERQSDTKLSCAFMPLSTDYKNSDVDNYITDALTEAIFATGKIRIIERTNLETILAEQKFQASGLVDEATAKSVGKIVGVDFVCYGTLKDLGDGFSVNARIVNVETGEICAISRATVTKDDYLQKQIQNNTVVKKNDVVTIPKTKEGKAVGAWKVKTYRDAFSNSTKYVFTINSSDTRMLFLYYKKADDSANSRVIAGIQWTENNVWNDENLGYYEVKGTNGKVVSKNLVTGSIDRLLNNSSTFYYAWKPEDGSRWLVEMMANSDSVAVRRNNLSRRFQTAGLLETMAAYGITWKEIDAALSSEEF